MDLINRTGARAQIFYTVVAEDRLLAAVVVRRTFRIDGERLVPDDGHPFPVAEQAIKTEYGEFEPETPFGREGFELFLLGKVYAHPAPAPQAEVSFEVGAEFQRRISASGDRTWVRGGAELVPSAALPFESLPLTMAYAYGGKTPTEVGEFSCPANAEGRGFYLSEEAALGGLLPNLESFEESVRTWRDQPKPVGVTPLPRSSSMRLERSLELDADTTPPRLRKIRPAYFNSAHPMMLLRRAPAAGTTLRVCGVRPGGRQLRFTLPADAYHVYVQLAEREHLFPSVPECLIVLAEEERVVLGYRCCFRYRMVRRERRAAVLYEGVAPGGPPPAYHIDWAALDSQQEPRRG